MRVLSRRVLVEFYGGPADGSRARVQTDPETGLPSAERLISQRACYPGMPLHVTQYRYRRHAAPEGSAAQFLYVYAPEEGDGE